MTGSHARHRPMQEEDRVRGGPALALMLFGVAVVIACVVPAWWLLRGELHRERPGVRITYGPPVEEREPLPARVGGLLETPIEPIAGGEGAADERSSGPPERWGWLDRDHRRARMPVERAMDLVVERYGAAASGRAP